MGEEFHLVERIPSVEEYNRIRGAAGLSVKDPASARVGLKNSLFGIGVEVKGELVGIGRVIGDGGIFFDIVDLAVLPEYQGRGFGKMMMERLMAYIYSNAGNNSFVSLFSNRGLASFYEKYGFRARDPESPGMSQKIIKT